MASPTKSVTIKLFVDKASNRVALAEAGGDFVNILLSFLTMPMGTIVRLLDKSSQLHCMDNLYRSVDETLGRSLFVSEAARTALLQPANSSEHIFLFLALSFGDILFTNRYVCGNKSCRSRSFTSFKGDKCTCGSPMTDSVTFTDGPSSYECGVFVNDSARFVISDSLLVNHLSTSQVFTMLEEMGAVYGDLVEKEVTAGRQELIGLLQRALISETSLTDVFLNNCKASNTAVSSSVSKTNPSREAAPGVSSESQDWGVEVQLLVDTDHNRLLYAESKDGSFAELLLLFLTCPLGAVVKILDGNSSLACVDNLYRSALCLTRSPSGLPCEMLVDPKIPRYYCCRNQAICVPVERNFTNHLCCYHISKDPMAPLMSMFDICESCGSKRTVSVQQKDPTKDGRFLKDVRLLVMDDLTVEAFSLTSCFQVLRLAGIDDPNGRSTVTEKTVKVGTAEAVAILKSCLTSTAPLSEALLK